MDGIINLNKPPGITSAKAVYRVRSLTGQRKSGHAGSLDPLATGVLLVCLGRATKLVESMMNLPKVYRAGARLDATSESFDADRTLVPVEAKHVPTEAELRAACAEFIGEIQQVPPSISALKVRGVPAYRRSARGEMLTLAPRPVQVYSFRVCAFDWPALEFEVCCGRGTYVRALIRDLGTRLGTGGYLTSLLRERVGPFRVDRAWTLEAIAAAPVRDVCLIPYEQVLDLLHGLDGASPSYV